MRALRLLADALANARSSGNARLELESAVLRFVLQAEDPTIDALSARIAALETGTCLRRPVRLRAPRAGPPRAAQSRARTRPASAGAHTGARRR